MFNALMQCNMMDKLLNSILNFALGFIYNFKLYAESNNVWYAILQLQF